MDKDTIFICQHKKACGEDKAKKMLESLKKQETKKEDHKKVYISIYGGEVHVNGPVAVCVRKPESLAEKIARFEALAERVAANRMLVHQVINDTFNEGDEDVLDDKIDDFDDVDDFGELVEKQPVAKPKEFTAEGSDTDNVGNDSVIADDESAQESSAEQSDMPSK